MRSRQLAALLIFVSFPLTLPSQGLETFAVGATVNGVFSNIADELRGIIEQAEDSANIVAMKSRIQATILLQNLSLLANQYTDKLFEELRETERQLFIDAQQLIDQWNAGNIETLEKLQELNEGLAATLSVIPGSKTEPRVLNYGPPYVVAQPRSVHRISFDGQFLGEGEPSLVFQGQSCDRIRKLETELEFECPNSIFSHYTSLKPVVGTLVVYRELGFFDWIGSIFSEDDDSRSYEVSLTAVPDEVGFYELTAYVSTEEIERKQRTQSFYQRNDHCSRGRTFSWSAIPQSGYEVDIQSVKYSVTTRSTNSKLNSVMPSVASIDVVARVVNNGSCGPKIPFSNDRAYYDARGAFGITVTWDDIKRTSKAIPNEAGKGYIAWGQDLAIELPADTKSFLLTVEHPTGEITSADRPGDYEWMNVAASPTNLILKPKSPAEIFGE